MVFQTWLESNGIFVKNWNSILDDFFFIFIFIVIIIYLFIFFFGGGYLLRIIWNWSKGNGMGESEINNKHCQRHDGPRGWVLSSKYLCQVISEVDQNSDSKSQPYLSIKISAKHLPQEYWPNFNFKKFTEVQPQSL